MNNFASQIYNVIKISLQLNELDKKPVTHSLTVYLL